MKEIIVIVGPTGVGKTKLSIELAKKLDAEIINGDSVSIYKKLNIGSAKPSIEERENIPHHCLDICDLEQNYSVFHYQKEVRHIIENLSKKNKRIIIVGGTGLYIKATLYQYEFQEETNIKTYNEYSNEQLVNELKKYAPATIPHQNNRKRLIRLLNKCENNEHIATKKDELLYPIKVVGLTTERDFLYQRINERVDHMIEMGLVEEVESLKKYYQTSRVLNSAIGYKEFVPYLFGDLSLDKVIEQIKQNSRRYAKRQYTFFKHQFPTKWFQVNFSNFEETIKEVYDYIEKEANY